MSQPLLARLRAKRQNPPKFDGTKPVGQDLINEWRANGVTLVSTNETYENQFDRAVEELFWCIKSTANFGEILQEGGIYFGCWLESTGTINTEILSRFLPNVAERTLASFAAGQREDGLFPYKLTDEGAIFNQIQLVTPLARTVWNHYLLNGRDHSFLRTMFEAMSNYDNWIAHHRDTGQTGAVEAFCCYDTGHDLSARFWHIPDTPFQNDPTQFDPNNPLLPLIAPDLTANIACQRTYLAKMAQELESKANEWPQKAEASQIALMDQCFDEEDGFFYDRDRHGRHVKIQSDNLLRVLACEIGDGAFFEASLSRYLLNTRKFLARFPLTSIAMDDPRFDPSAGKNSWCGPSNLLTLIRTPHAFEHHHRHVELTFVLYPALSALFEMERFAQTIDPFTGAPGFTQTYSPAILGLLDFTERLCGILPRPEQTIWFTGLTPKSVTHRQEENSTAYARTIDGSVFELINGTEFCTLYKDETEILRFPKGVRIVTDRAGNLQSIIGMQIEPVSGHVITTGKKLDFTVGPNAQLDLIDGSFEVVREGGYVPINHNVA